MSSSFSLQPGPAPLSCCCCCSSPSLPVSRPPTPALRGRVDPGGPIWVFPCTAAPLPRRGVVKGQGSEGAERRRRASPRRVFSPAPPSPRVRIIAIGLSLSLALSLCAWVPREADPGGGPGHPHSPPAPLIRTARLPGCPAAQRGCVRAHKRGGGCDDDAGKKERTGGRPAAAAAGGGGGARVQASKPIPRARGGGGEEKGKKGCDTKMNPPAMNWRSPETPGKGGRESVLQKGVRRTLLCVRPYYGESTVSRPICEVKLY